MTPVKCVCVGERDRKGTLLVLLLSLFYRFFGRGCSCNNKSMVAGESSSV